VVFLGMVDARGSRHSPLHRISKPRTKSRACHCLFILFLALLWQLWRGYGKNSDGKGIVRAIVM